MRSNVDLPEPLRPTKQIRSSAATAKVAPESSGVAPKVRLTSCSRSSGGAIDGYRLKLFSTVGSASASRRYGRASHGCKPGPQLSAREKMNCAFLLQPRVLAYRGWQPRSPLREDMHGTDFDGGVGCPAGMRSVRLGRSPGSGAGHDSKTV